MDRHLACSRQTVRNYENVWLLEASPLQMLLSKIQFSHNLIFAFRDFLENLDLKFY